MSMSEGCNLQEEILSQACATCPMREIAAEAWRQHEGDEEQVYEMGESFNDALYTLTKPLSPDEEDQGDAVMTGNYRLAAALNELNEGVLPLHHLDAEDGYDAFYSSVDGQEVVAASPDIDEPTVMPEAEFEDTTKNMLACLRRHRESDCYGKSGQEDVLPTGLIDLKSGMNHIETVVRHGSDDEVKSLLSRFYEEFLALGGADKVLKVENPKAAIHNNDSEAMRNMLRAFAEILGYGITTKED